VVRTHNRRELIFANRDPVAALRKLTVCQVVRLSDQGRVARCRAHKNEARRLLTVRVWWRAGTAGGLQASLKAGIELDLRLWLWPGWTVVVESVPGHVRSA
jgi:hypothetical protein